jgi:predicted hydrocarbon binding protein
MATALHERLVFDTARGAVLDGDRRYVLVRADVLMGLFANLEGTAREAALEALGRSVREHGAGSVRAYRDAVGADTLPSMMEGAAASLGWGHWRFDAIRLHDDAAPALALTVADSPFAAAAPRGTARACHAIGGMLEALGDALWSRPAAAQEIACAAAGADACRFVVAPRAAAVSQARVTAGAAAGDPFPSEQSQVPPARRSTRPGDKP